MATWLQTVNRNMGGERGVNTAKAVASLGMGNPLGALYYGYKAITTPSERGWGSAIQKTGSTTVPDFQNQISAATSNLFSRPADLPGTGGYGTTVQDVQNTITPMEGTGLPSGEEDAAPPVQLPKITPQTMPVNVGADYSSLPSVTKADLNRIKMASEVANYFSDPSSRQIGYQSVADRFDPLAAHYRFVKSLDMAKFRNELNPTQAYEDDLFQKEMARRAANMYQ